MAYPREAQGGGDGEGVIGLPLDGWTQLCFDAGAPPADNLYGVPGKWY